MQTINIDNLPFIGPYTIGKTEIPSVRAIALICTEAGEGMKIMSVLHGNDISGTIAESPKRSCWEKHAFHGNIDVYLHETDMSDERMEQFRINAISKRSKYIFCDELPRIEDDW